MKNTVWSKVVRSSADPKRVKHFLELLAANAAKGTLEHFSPEQAQVLSALLSGSQAMSALLVSHPNWLYLLDPEFLRYPRRKQGLLTDVKSWLKPCMELHDIPSALRQLREFKQREMLRIAARDLAGLAEISEITREISDVADICLDGVWQACSLQMSTRIGQPYHKDAKGAWQPTYGCVLGLGKLGGQELNYSSDVDVLVVYTDEGTVFTEPPKKAKTTKAVMSNHQFFNRLAESFIAEVTGMAPEGTLFRVDLRLRPEGSGGPLSRSVSGYENYYSQWGQTWERMMLIKARGVAGDPTLAAEFLEMVQSFRYPRCMIQGVLREIAAMKDRIENEAVRSGALERNIKLGPGGIREIEFIVQALQLLHGGRQPFLQSSQTLRGLEKLAQYDLITVKEAQELKEAYGFLRNLEHRLQMEDNLQTHTLPAHRLAQERIAKLMGFSTLNAFEKAHSTHRIKVRHIFEKTLKGGASKANCLPRFPRSFEGSEPIWRGILAQFGFKEVDKALRVLREFVDGPGFVHVSPRTRELAFQILSKLFALCPSSAPKTGKPKSVRQLSNGQQSDRSSLVQSSTAPLSDPDRVITRLDSFITAYGARGTLFELWNSNPAIFELLVLLFDRSEFLAELAIRTPDLVDELVLSGRLRQRKSSAETLGDLRHGINDKDQSFWLRRYHQTELMRIGLRDILGLAGFEQYLTELSALADACLKYALEVVMRKHRLKTSPFVVVGLGKLGGGEIDYGSDLDIIFVTNTTATNLRLKAKYALELMELVSARSEHGLTFHTDARLRPDGEKGLLVNTFRAYEEYYRQRAQLWEIQSLTRARTVAGDLELGERFQQLAATLTDFKVPALPLAAYGPDWKQRIHHMRLRIEKERTPRNKEDLAIKTGKGGLMDAEFIAQATSLANGWHEANTLRTLEYARRSGALPHANKLITNYRRLRRVEGILRRWSYEGETLLPDDPAAYNRVSVRCGFASPEAFRTAISEWRSAIREVYTEIFGSNM